MTMKCGSGILSRRSVAAKLMVAGVVLLTLVPRSAAAQTAEVQAIIDKAVQAQGGGAKVAKRKAMQIKVKGKGNFEGVGEVTFTLEDVWQVPGQYKSVIQFNINQTKLTQVLVLNGSRGWISVNGQTQPLSGALLTEVKEQVHAEMLDTLLPLKEKGNELSLLPEAKINGRDAVGIKVTSQGHRDVKLYFDKATGLQAKREHRILSNSGQEVVQEVFFSDYKEVEGVKHWMKIAAHRDGKKTLEAEVTEIKFFDRVPDSVFSQP